MGGVDGAAAEDDFLAGASVMQPAAMFVEDADGALAGKENAQYLGAGDDRQVGAIQNWLDVGGRSTLALAVGLRQLIEANAFLGGAIKIMVNRQASSHAGVDKGAGERVGFTSIRQWSSARPRRGTRYESWSGSPLF